MLDGLFWRELFKTSSKKKNGDENLIRNIDPATVSDFFL